MNIFSYIVTKNEAGRYLEDTLSSLREQVDGICVFDDRSDDNTVEILKNLRIPHMINSWGRPFLDDESAFRERAWRFMEDLFEPLPGDWILTLDADEALREKRSLQEVCVQAHVTGQDALWMHVHELWSPTEIRTDGYWGTIRALRLAAWKANGKFAPKKMGGGSLPDYIQNAGETSDLDILHYGYVRQEDREAKHARYSGTSGHSSRHISSILQSPTLAQLPPIV